MLTRMCSVRADLWLLFYHFFSVALYAIYIMFTRPRLVSAPGEKPVYAAPRVDEYPALTVKSFIVVSPSSLLFRTYKLTVHW